MTNQQAKFTPSRAARILAAAGSILILSMTMAVPAKARGGHGAHHRLRGHEIHSADGSGLSATGRGHGDDAYVKSAAEQEDKLLNNRIKSICRGC